MKVFISADMEGISGIAKAAWTESEDNDFSRARELMTGDVNAAIQGCLDAGATEVVVKDAHGGADNILVEKLLAPAQLIQGWGDADRMMEGVDASFNAALLVGYHARVMTEAGTISHTMTGQTRGLWYNGVEIGESGISAAHAGAFGVPLVFACGDEALCSEVQAVIGAQVGTAAVKSAINRECVRMLPLDEARALIRAGVAGALNAVVEVPPFMPGGPIEVRMGFQTPRQAAKAALVPTVERLDPTTVRAQAADGLLAANLVSVLLDVAR
jgi:D-amino peptidase